MSNHIVSKDDLYDFVVSTQMFAQHEKGFSKSLTFFCNASTSYIWYTLNNNGVKTKINCLETAIEMYNEVEK